VLVGAGHAHLHIIKHAELFRRQGHELVVVAPGPFWYSGLATGMLGGFYSPELDQIDVAALAEQGGGRVVCDRMVGLDRSAGAVTLERSGRLDFDALSLNLGSAPAPIPGSDSADVFTVKPIERLRDLRAALERRFATNRRAPTRIVVAGGGATAAELAGNIARMAEQHRAVLSITVMATGGHVLQHLPAGAGAAVRANLEGRGVRFRTGFRVGRIDEGCAISDGGDRVGFDLLVNATGLHPSKILAGFDLPLAPDGGMRVNDTLRSPADQRIHGGGDCVALDGHDLPRIGVYAIRQAPVLLHNLLATLAGRAPRRFEPQKQYLWIINLGDGSAVAIRGR
jgi:NADH dehydrogenase FAD-containing subunit